MYHLTNVDIVKILLRGSKAIVDVSTFFDKRGLYSAKKGAVKITSDGFISSEFSNLSKILSDFIVSVIKVS